MTSSGGKARGHKQNCKHSDTQRTEEGGRILGLESAKLGSLPPPPFLSPGTQPHPIVRSLVGLLDTSDPQRKQRERGPETPHSALLTGQIQNKAWCVRDRLLIHSSQELSLAQSGARHRLGEPEE